MAESTQWEVETPTGPLTKGLGIRDVLRFFVSNFFLLAGGLALGVCLGLLLQKSTQKVYQSKGDFLIDEMPFIQSSRTMDAETSRDIVQTLILSIPNRDMLAAIERRLKIEPGRISFSDLDLPVKLTGSIPKANVSVTPLKNSRMGAIEATSQSPEFAADVVNAILAELQLYNIVGGKFKALQVNLELTNTKVESSLKQLLDVSSQRIKIEQENVELDNYLKQKLPLETFPAFSKDSTLNNIKTQLILIDSEYQNIAATATRGTRLIGRHAELQSLKTQLNKQAERLAAGLRSEYEIILTQEKNLQEDFRKAKDQIDEISSASSRLAQSLGDPRAMEQLAAEQTDKPGGPANIIVVVDRATPQSLPAKPKLILNLILGCVFGLGLGFGLSLLRVLLDNRIKTAAQVESRLEVPCLAELPKRPALATGSRRAGVFSHPVYPLSLGFLRSHLQQAALKRKGQGYVMGFTPSSRKQSCSQFVTDLAILLAQAEKKTLVIDLNLSEPRVANILGIETKKGLGTWLTTDDPIGDFVSYSTVRELAVLSAEPDARDTEDLLSRRPLSDVLPELQKEWDFILIDSPCIVNDWSLMLTLPSGAPMIITAEWKKTRTEMIQQTIARTRGPAWRIDGVVLLNCPRAS